MERGYNIKETCGVKKASHNTKRRISRMLIAGIDVAKGKHDCCILDANTENLFPTFILPNNQNDLGELYERLNSVTGDISEIKVGLEATNHNSLNLLGSLIAKGLITFVINPLHTNLYQKGQSLRKAKTDKVDASSIAMMSHR